MTPTRPSPRSLRRAALMSMTAAVVGPAALLGGPIASAHASGPFSPGNLLVSTSVWQTDAPITAGTTQLPPGCTGTGCTAAIAGGTYPQVFNNDAVDGSFGVTEPIVLDQLNPATGPVVSTLDVPNSSQPGVTRSSTRWSPASPPSPSWRLNLSTDRQLRDLHGLRRPGRRRSTSPTPTRPGVIDSTNPVDHARLPGGCPARSATATSSSPRPTPTAATTVGPRS